MKYKGSIIYVSVYIYILMDSLIAKQNRNISTE